MKSMIFICLCLFTILTKSSSQNKFKNDSVNKFIVLSISPVSVFFDDITLFCEFKNTERKISYGFAAGYKHPSFILPVISENFSMDKRLKFASNGLILKGIIKKSDLFNTTLFIATHLQYRYYNSDNAHFTLDQTDASVLKSAYLSRQTHSAGIQLLIGFQYIKRSFSQELYAGVGFNLSTHTTKCHSLTQLYSSSSHELDPDDIYDYNLSPDNKLISEFTFHIIYRLGFRIKV